MISSLRLAGKPQQVHTQPGPKKTQKTRKFYLTASSSGTFLKSQNSGGWGRWNVKCKYSLSFKGVKNLSLKANKEDWSVWGQEHWQLLQRTQVQPSLPTRWLQFQSTICWFFLLDPNKSYMSAFRLKRFRNVGNKLSLLFLYHYMIKSKLSRSQKRIWYTELPYNIKTRWFLA